MLDNVVVFFVKEEATIGEVSEVYIPALRVIQGSVEPHVLSLLGMDLKRTRVIRYMDKGVVFYSLIVDLTALKNVSGHLKVIRLEEADDNEMGILYEAYLAERLCPYFREEVSNKVCKWAGKNRIVSASCNDSIMDVVLQDGKVRCFSPDGAAVLDEWLRFCEGHQIDRVSRERLEEMVEDYFVCCQTDCRFPEEETPQFTWTKTELCKMLAKVELNHTSNSVEFRVEYKDGEVDFGHLTGNLNLRPLGDLVDTLMDMYNEFHVDIAINFDDSI